MAEQLETDVLVAGAGIVGVSTALALAQRGLAVVLADRQGIADGTSFGNAGLIQCESVIPYAFPRALRKIMRYGLNLAPEAHVHFRDLLRIAPWLLAYWRNGTPERVRQTALAMQPLVQAAAEAHRTMARSAGAEAMLRPTGYLKIYRSEQALAMEAAKDEASHRAYATSYEMKSEADLCLLEPGLIGRFAGAIMVPSPLSVADPQAIARAYARHFEERGGQFVTADARQVERSGGGWRLRTDAVEITSRRLVLTLGPWTNDVLRHFAKPLPIGFKRGYHMQYAATVPLHRPVMFPEYGFLIAPMQRGLRLTTGAEFASRDAPETPVQLTRAERAAAELFPLGPRLDAAPWLGARPCLPDLIPAIGPVGGAPALWLNTAHHHLGLTLGPVCAQLLADLMTGAKPLTDPAPYSPDRFAR